MSISFPTDAAGIKGLSYRPVCGVVATAVVTGKTFTECWNHYSKSKRGNWKGALLRSTIHQTIKEFGFELTPCYADFTGDMLQTFMRYIMIKDPDSVFLVHNNNHVQVVSGANVIDQGGKKHFMQYRWKRKRIELICKVTPVRPNIMKTEEIEKEVEIMSVTKETKFTRANQIVRDLINKGVKRKDILAQLTAELDTTWGSASTFYHRVVRDIKQKENV